MAPKKSKKAKKDLETPDILNTYKGDELTNKLE